MKEYLHEFQEEFRLVDVEGVVLSAGESLIIREPSGFDEIDITLLRDRDMHGFSFEFSDPEQKYGFDFNTVEGEPMSSREFLQTVFDAKGSNGRVLFEYYTVYFGTYEREIQAKIEFDTYSRKHEKIEFSTSRENLSTLLNNRFDTKINFLDTLGLDGNVLTALSPVDVYTHSLLFQLEGEISNQTRNIIYPGFRTVERFPDQAGNDYIRENESFFLAHPFNTVSAELQLFSYQAEMLFAEDLNNNFDGFFLFNAPNDGTYNIEYTNPISQVQAYFQNTFTDSGTGFCELFYKINEGGAGVSLGTVDGIRDDEPNTGEQGYKYETYLLQGTIKLNLKKGDNVYFYTRYVHEENDGFGNARRRRWRNNCSFNSLDTFTGDLPTDDDYGLFRVFALTSAPETKTPAYFYHESINRVLESICNKSGVLDSDFFNRVELGAVSDGGGALNVFTYGLLLRQFANEKGLRISMKDMFEHLQAVFGVGLQAGEDTVLIQKYSEFYADKLIMKLENAYNISYNFDDYFSFNKIEIGFKKYIEGDEFQRVNTLDEFHTEHEYSAPLRQINKSFDKISPVIMSGYLIELTRRQSFEETVSERWKYDDEIFGIAVQRFDKIESGVEVDAFRRININTIYFFGYFQFLENESSITIIGGAYAGTYNIVSVREDVDEATDVVRTFIEIDGDLTGTAINTTGLINLSQTYVTSEKNEPFNQIDGIISPTTVYNARHNIKSMLYNQAPLINSGLNYNNGTEQIKNQFFVNNGDAKFQFKVGEGNNTLDPDRQYLEQDADLSINQMNQFKRDFIPVIISLEVPLSYTQLKYIKQALLNQNEDDVNFGYLAVDNEFGEEVKFYIFEMKFNPRSGIAKFTGAIKS